MAKLRLQNEWKMWGSLALFLLLIVGYLWYASRPPTEGDEPLWRVTGVIDASTIKVRGSGQVMDVSLAGLQIPQSQQEAAKEFLNKTLKDQWVRVKLLGQDTGQVKKALLFISGEDVNARMIRWGLAQINRDEKDFDVRPYMELEQEAEMSKRGLWNK
ncbi:MAG: thermonuclease family protein [Syntrophaceae bacterium]|nr:thermonuclease family protein [Syntrophaceae bacterium]